MSHEPVQDELSSETIRWRFGMRAVAE